MIRTETEGAMDNAFNVLRNRIDRYGVVQPNIQRLETQGRILVELPGIKEPERVRKAYCRELQALSFGKLIIIQRSFLLLQNANDRIREIQAAEKNLKSAEGGAEMTAEETSQGESALPDLSGDRLHKVETSGTDTTGEEISLLDQLQADSLAGDTTAQTLEGFVKENPLLGILQPNVTRNGQFVPGAGVGFAHIKDTGQSYAISESSPGPRHACPVISNSTGI